MKLFLLKVITVVCDVKIDGGGVLINALINIHNSA